MSKSLQLAKTMGKRYFFPAEHFRLAQNDNFIIFLNLSLKNHMSNLTYFYFRERLTISSAHIIFSNPRGCHFLAFSSWIEFHLAILFFSLHLYQIHKNNEFTNTTEGGIFFRTLEKWIQLQNLPLAVESTFLPNLPCELLYPSVDDQTPHSDNQSGDPSATGQKFERLRLRFLNQVDLRTAFFSHDSRDAFPSLSLARLAFL